MTWSDRFLAVSSYLRLLFSIRSVASCMCLWLLVSACLLAVLSHSACVCMSLFVFAYFGIFMLASACCCRVLSVSACFCVFLDVCSFTLIIMRSLACICSASFLRRLPTYSYASACFGALGRKSGASKPEKRASTSTGRVRRQQRAPRIFLHNQR